MTLTTPTVQIVDDDPSFLTAASRMLRASGFAVKTFSSAKGIAHTQRSKRLSRRESSRSAYNFDVIQQMPTIEMKAEIAYDRILLATDFSPAADVAATYAVALARRFSSTLELIHVIDRSVPVSSTGIGKGPAGVAAKRSAEERLQRMADRISGVKVTNEIIEGLLPALHILDVALESRSELIVIGTSSKHGFKNRILGSTAEEVIRRAVCPVLTVGPHVSRPADVTLTFQSIIYATDLSPLAAKAAPYAFSFAKGSGANLYLCHVIEDTDGVTPSTLEASSASLRNLVPKHAYDWCNPDCVTEKGNAAEAILKLARRANADLIVLAARQSSFWLTHIDTGLTPALLAGARCPVFTVRVTEGIGEMLHK